MADNDLSDRFAHTVEELRDRTAQAVSSDGPSVWRALAQLRHRVEEVAPSVVEHLDAREDSLTRELHDLERNTRRTTWPRRLIWLLTGAALGAGAAWLADPDRGDARRAELAEEASERARKASSEVRERARVATERIRGQVTELVADDEGDADDERGVSAPPLPSH